MKTRKAFTLTELVVGIMVMAITYAAMSLSSSAAKQTAQHEAERLAAYIFRTIQKADRIHTGFNMYTGQDINTSEYFIEIKWPGGEKNHDRSFKPSPGCKYVDNFDSTTSDGENTYMPEDKRFKWGGHITVTDSEGEVYYVIIAATEGRIHTSETEPQ